MVCLTAEPGGALRATRLERSAAPQSCVLGGGEGGLCVGEVLAEFEEVMALSKAG